MWLWRRCLTVNVIVLCDYSGIGIVQGKLRIELRIDRVRFDYDTLPGESGECPPLIVEWIDRIVYRLPDFDASAHIRIGGTHWHYCRRTLHRLRAEVGHSGHGQDDFLNEGGDRRGAGGEDDDAQPAACQHGDADQRQHDRAATATAPARAMHAHALVGNLGEGIVIVLLVEDDRRIHLHPSGARWRRRERRLPAHADQHAFGALVVRAQLEHAFEGSALTLLVFDGIRQQPPGIGVERIGADERHEQSKGFLLVALTDEAVGFL